MFAIDTSLKKNLIPKSDPIPFINRVITEEVGRQTVSATKSLSITSDVGARMSISLDNVFSHAIQVIHKLNEAARTFFRGRRAHSIVIPRPTSLATQWLSHHPQPIQLVCFP